MRSGLYRGVFSTERRLRSMAEHVILYANIEREGRMVDAEKTGQLIRRLRKEKGLTQAALAEKIGVTDKAVSKWERAQGCPDISLIKSLCSVFSVEASVFLGDGLKENRRDGGNMRRLQFYLCPVCGNLMTATGGGERICCGRPLNPLKPASPDADHMPAIEPMEDELYITFPHEMTKEHFITFAAWMSYDRMLFIKLYPEQDAALRMPQFRRGKLIFHCSRHGLMQFDLKL